MKVSDCVLVDALSALCKGSVSAQPFKRVLHFKSLDWAQSNTLSRACFMGKSLKLQSHLSSKEDNLI